MSTPPAAKLPYSPPRLVVYGDLRVITQNRTRKGNDNGTSGNQFST